MKVQHTKISPRNNDLYVIEMLIADEDLPQIEDEQIHFVSHIQVKEAGRYPSLAELQRAALAAVRDELDQRKKEIVSASSPLQ